MQADNLEKAKARLPRWMSVLAAGITAGLLVASHARLASGFALGAVLAILNYCWLHQAIANVLQAGNGGVPKRVLLKFLLRYPLAFAGVYLVYRTRWLPVSAIFAGLFVPVGGVLIEAVVQIKQGFRIGEQESH